MSRQTVRRPGTRRRVGIVLLLGCIALLVLGMLVAEGILPWNEPGSAYPVRGVDVSAWQGQIDWQVLAGERGISFAFIKATEGSGLVDRCFDQNWAGALETQLRIGAYHFFSYDSSGDAQADLFIQTVPITPSMLPPVVDVEFYGDKEESPPARAEVSVQLQTMLDRLEAHYGQKPILYTTGKVYRLYIQDGYEAYPIWIRDIIGNPELPDGRDWLFWQYSNRGRLKGYAGEEQFIDMNAFSGSQAAFDAMFPPD